MKLLNLTIWEFKSLERLKKRLLWKYQKFNLKKLEKVSSLRLSLPINFFFKTYLNINLIFKFANKFILILFRHLFFRGKCAKNNTEESAEKIKITTEGEENEDDATAAKPNQVLETSTEATKPETFQHFKFITFLPKFRKTEKNLDETSAPEFEKVELNDESEKTDKEKGVENEKEKVRIIPKVRSLISKLKMAPRAKKEDVEMGETESKEEDKDEVDEEIMKELEPEDKEEKEKDEKKVVGSETPV